MFRRHRFRFAIFLPSRGFYVGSSRLRLNADSGPLMSLAISGRRPHPHPAWGWRRSLSAWPIKPGITRIKGPRPWNAPLGVRPVRAQDTRASTPRGGFQAPLLDITLVDRPDERPPQVLPHNQTCRQEPRHLPVDKDCSWAKTLTRRRPLHEGGTRTLPRLTDGGEFRIRRWVRVRAWRRIRLPRSCGTTPACLGSC